MERNETYTGPGFVTSSDAMIILGVGNAALAELVRQGIVRPPRIPRASGKNLWGPREIFRAFMSLRLAEEYKTKYGNRNSKYLYDQVRRDLFSAERTRGREFLESDQWSEVATRAMERGLDLLDLQKVQLNRGFPAED